MKISDFTNNLTPEPMLEMVTKPGIKRMQGQNGPEYQQNDQICSQYLNFRKCIHENLSYHWSYECVIKFIVLFFNKMIQMYQ